VADKENNSGWVEIPWISRENLNLNQA